MYLYLNQVTYQYYLIGGRGASASSFYHSLLTSGDFGAWSCKRALLSFACCYPINILTPSGLIN